MGFGTDQQLFIFGREGSVEESGQTVGDHELMAATD